MLRLGVMGTGNISKAYCNAVHAFPKRFQITAVCNHSEKAKSMMEQFGLDRYWDDYHKFVKEAPMDVVVNLLPHDVHYDSCKAALMSGKPVLVEKPFVTEMSQCLELVSLAEEKKLILMVGQNLRYDNGPAALKEFIDSGKMGKIHQARMDIMQNLHNYTDPPHWLYQGKIAGGGPVISIGVHFIDLMRYFLGDIKSVMALSKTASEDFKDAEDYCCALLEFKNGAIGQLFTTYSAAALPYVGMYWIFGDKAVVHTLPPAGKIQDLHPQVAFLEGTKAPYAFHPMELGAPRYPTDATITNELLHFADCIEQGKSPLTSARDNIGTMAAIFGIYESAKRGGEKVQLSDIK